MITAEENYGRWRTQTVRWLEWGRFTAGPSFPPGAPGLALFETWESPPIDRIRPAHFRWSHGPHLYKDRSPAATSWRARAGLRPTLLQRFYRVGERALSRFAEQQVNVLRHDHIPADAQFETAAHTFQPRLKYLLGYGSREPATAMVAAERHEVSLPGRLESFQSPGHNASLRLRKSPLKPKNGLSGPPAVLHAEDSGSRGLSFLRKSQNL
jgi:hypothetical protein